MNSLTTSPQSSPAVHGQCDGAPGVRNLPLDRADWLQRELRELAVALEYEGRRDTADRVSAVACEIRELESRAQESFAGESPREGARDPALAEEARDLIVRRRIAAPPELVFRVWTTDLPAWWGPHGMSVPEWQLELQSGGIFRTRMRAADGREYCTRGVVLEVAAPRRLVFTDAFDQGWAPGAEAFLVAVATFDDDGQGGTDCTLCARHWTQANAVRHVRMGFYQVWAESLDRLADCCRHHLRFLHE